MRMSPTIAMLLSLLLFNACGPAVQVRSLKPAEVDMSAMRRLVVLDFDHYSGSVDSVEDFVVGIVAHIAGIDYGSDNQIHEAASHATSKLIMALSASGYFTILDAGHLRGQHLQTMSKAQEIGRPPGAAAILAGDLDYAACERTSFFKEEKVRDSARGQDVVKDVPWVRQKCRLILSYRIVRVADNSLVVKKQFSDDRSEEAEEGSRYGLHEPSYWYREMIDGIIPQIVRQLAPYEVTETRRLKKDKTDDPEMERATVLAKNGNLGAAGQIFLQRWQSTANPAAGFNAAIFAEAEGDLEGAIALLDEVIRISSDSSIINEHRRMVNALAEQRRAEAQMK